MSTDPTDPLAPLRKAARRAAKDGNPGEALRLGHEYLLAKAIVAERLRAARPQANRFGPGATSLVTNRHALADDPTVSGI